MERRHFTAILTIGSLAAAIGALGMTLGLEARFSGAGAWLISGGILASVIGSAGLSVTAQTRSSRERYAMLAAVIVAAASTMILITSVAVLIFFDVLLDALGARGGPSITDLAAITAWFALWIAIPAAGIPSFMTWRRRRLVTSGNEGPIRARCRSRGPQRRQ